MQDGRVGEAGNLAFLALFDSLVWVTHARVAQLDRASGYEPEGREFESLRAHHAPINTTCPTPHKTVILSEAPSKSIAKRMACARSRRACPERSRGNPGDAYWQMLFQAFRPQL
jgi:hypothetical protein